jgi:hypothetical protein
MARRERIGRSGEWHPWKGVVLRWRKKPQGTISFTPAVTYAFMFLEYRERLSERRQKISHRKPSLAAPYDYRSESLVHA